jgi:hypothetical protein
MRIAGMVMALCAATLVTLAFIPGVASLAPWTAAVGALMVAAGAVMAYQGSTLTRQLAAEHTAGYSTDRWAVSPRPEVAPGTSVVIRTAGSDPYALGSHRVLTKWARDIQRGSVRPMPEMKRDPSRSGRDRDISGSISTGVVVGGGCYIAAILLVGVTFNMWSYGIVLGVIVGGIGLVVGAIGHHVARRNRAGVERRRGGGV